MTHLSDDEVERLLVVRLEPAGEQKAARHLLAGCGICSRKLVEQAPDLLLEKAAEARHRRVARRPARDLILAAALEQDARWRTDEKKLAQSLELLHASPQGYDALTFRQMQALHGRPLVEALRKRSHELRYTDPKTMRWLAYNAVKTAESLRPEEHGPALILDLQALTWTDLANAYKVNDELAEAEAAFARARDLLRRGSGDPRYLADVASREASLRGSQRRLAEARELFDRTYRLYLKLGDRHLAGRALISKGGLTEYDGTSLQGAPLFRQGLALLDPDRDPELVSVGLQGLITALVGCGEHREAGRLLLKGDLRQRLPNIPHVRWVEGRLLSSLGQLTKAESALRKVRDELLEGERSSTAAVAGLDLLPILLRQGKHGQARRTAREIYDTLQSLGLPREAAKAHLYLQ